MGKVVGEAVRIERYRRGPDGTNLRTRNANTMLGSTDNHHCVRCTFALDSGVNLCSSLHAINFVTSWHWGKQPPRASMPERIAAPTPQVRSGPTSPPWAMMVWRAVALLPRRRCHGRDRFRRPWSRGWSDCKRAARDSLASAMRASRAWADACTEAGKPCNRSGRSRRQCHRYVAASGAWRPPEPVRPGDYVIRGRRRRLGRISGSAWGRELRAR